MGQQHLTEQQFDSLGLDQRLLGALHRLEFKHCTPIQAKSLPLLLSGKDVAGQAQTGTGKTLAFLLACAQRLLTSEAPTAAGKPRTLILAPTRELAIQIHKDAENLFKDLPLRLAICYGGKAYEQQKMQFEQPVDVLIGTPGRLIDFFKQRLFNFKSIEVMVLDEADRMFDMGFIADVRYMLRRLTHPEERLNMLFSATMAQKVMELAYEHMNQAQLITIDAGTPAVERIEQSVYHPANHEKIPLLLGLMKKTAATAQHHLRQHQVRNHQNLGIPTRQRPVGGNHFRRHPPEQARVATEKISRRRILNPGGDRCRLARTAYSGCDSRIQLRFARTR